jgi:hypothetical protein
MSKMACKIGSTKVYFYLMFTTSLPNGFRHDGLSHVTPLLEIFPTIVNIPHTPQHHHAYCLTLRIMKTITVVVEEEI